MYDLEKIIPLLVSLQKKLSSVDNIWDTLGEHSEVFVNSPPAVVVNTYNDDEVVVSGVIPNILSPEDISVKLDGGVILRINCTWHKNDDTGNISSTPQKYNKKVIFPFRVNPDTLTVTYKKAILQISAKKEKAADSRVAQVKFEE